MNYVTTEQEQLREFDTYICDGVYCTGNDDDDTFEGEGSVEVLEETETYTQEDKPMTFNLETIKLVKFLNKRFEWETQGEYYYVHLDDEYELQVRLTEAGFNARVFDQENETVSTSSIESVNALKLLMVRD